MTVPLRHGFAGARSALDRSHRERLRCIGSIRDRVGAGQAGVSIEVPLDDARKRLIRLERTESPI